jgi:hypothetical protein
MSFWQLLALATLFVGVILAAATIYFKIKEKKRTENRFNVVALWSCATLAASVVHLVVSSSSPLELLFEAFGVHAERPSLAEKMLAVVLVGFYIWQVRQWSTTWSGLQTERRFENRQAGHSPSLLWDGLEETWRIAKLRPAPKPYSKRVAANEGLQVSKPLLDLSYEEQIRSLALAIWKEYIINEQDWIAEARCWRGTDKAMDETILLVCCTDESELRTERLESQVHFERSRHRLTRLIIVVERPGSKLKVGQCLSKFAGQCDVYSFEEFVNRALPLSRYRYEIEQDFCHRHLPNSEFALHDVIAPITLRASGLVDFVASRSALLFDEYLSQWLASADMRQIALLGDYGQGKSTAAIYLAYRLLHDRAFFEFF